MTVNPYTQKIAAITARLNAVNAALANSADMRKHFALEAVDNNDPKAVAALKHHDDQAEELRREHSTLTAALEQLGQFEQQYADDAAAEDAANRQRQVRNLSDAAIALSKQADDAMAHLCQVLDRRVHLLQQLNQLAPGGPASVLSRKRIADSAAHAAGLRQHLTLEHIPPNHIATLLDAAACLRRNDSDRGEAA